MCVSRGRQTQTRIPDSAVEKMTHSVSEPIRTEDIFFKIKISVSEWEAEGSINKFRVAFCVMAAKRASRDHLTLISERTTGSRSANDAPSIIISLVSRDLLQKPWRVWERPGSGQIARRYWQETETTERCRKNCGKLLPPFSGL